MNAQFPWDSSGFGRALCVKCSHPAVKHHWLLYIFNNNLGHMLLQRLIQLNLGSFEKITLEMNVWNLFWSQEVSSLLFLSRFSLLIDPAYSLAYIFNELTNYLLIIFHYSLHSFWENLRLQRDCTVLQIMLVPFVVVIVLLIICFCHWKKSLSQSSESEGETMMCSE